jgi:Phosphotransferase system cellobiose-specific component IIC
LLNLVLSQDYLVSMNLLSFGLPIVLNPIMFIPWILVPVTNAVIAYVVTKIGWVVPLVILNSGNEPIFISTWILGAFHLSPVVLTFVLVVLDVIIYSPFVIINQRNEREQALKMLNLQQPKGVNFK